MKRVPEAEHDLIMSQVCIVIYRQDGLCLDGIVRQEAVVEAVFSSAYNLSQKISK